MHSLNATMVEGEIGVVLKHMNETIEFTIITSILENVDDFQVYNHEQISLGHFISVVYFSPMPVFGLQIPPSPFNVGHKLVHFQPCTLFSTKRH